MFVHAFPKLLPDVEGLEVGVGRALRAASRLVREAACAAGGHDYLLGAAKNRIFLRCADCGHETPGWHIDVRAAGRRPRSGNDITRGGVSRPAVNDTGADSRQSSKKSPWSARSSRTPSL
jgi:hypothetical protein